MMEDGDSSDYGGSSECSDMDPYFDSSDSDTEFGLAEEAPQSRQAQYEVLSEENVRERMLSAVGDVASVLSVPPDDAAALLRLSKWDTNLANETWFGDNAAVRGKIGSLDPPAEVPSDTELTCQVCFEAKPKQEMLSASCCHFFCRACWGGYVEEAISSGPACLNLRCPIPDCSAKVPMSVMDSVVSEEAQAKLRKHELRAFVETNPAFKWCPAPGCDSAVCCLAGASAFNEPMDVTCSCQGSFCFACNNEAHRPVDCETVEKWILKNSAESENLNWILANTKPCPKCKRPIEKSQGCMHMTCSQCKFEFCWLCNGAWGEHGERTGGFYACNRYEAAWKSGELSDEHKRRENAKNSLERYMHYYERFAAHGRACQKALEDQRLTAEGADYLEELSEMTQIPVSQLKFITDAWEQVVICRRVLKWTYAYGYYKFPAADTNKAAAGQKDFFEFLQGDAEWSLERLHEEAETRVKRFLDRQEPIEKFGAFQVNLKGLIDVTRDYFGKFVSQLELGFDSLEETFVGSV